MAEYQSRGQQGTLDDLKDVMSLVNLRESQSVVLDTEGFSLVKVARGGGGVGGGGGGGVLPINGLMGMCR